MKKLICLYSVAFHNSLLGQRFVFDDNPEAPNLSPEAQKQEPTFDERLKALGDVRDDPEALAAALENALRTLEQGYEGKAEQRVSEGQGRLDTLMDALGATDKEKKELTTAYGAGFVEDTNGWKWGGDQDMTERMEAAQEADAQTELVVLQEVALTEEQTLYEQAVTANDERTERAQEWVDFWAGDTGIPQLEDAVETAEDELAQGEKDLRTEAKLFGVKGNIDALMNVGREDFGDAVIKTREKETPGWAKDEGPEGVQTTIDNRFRIFNDLKKNVDTQRQAVAEAKLALEEGKKNQEWWKDELAQAKDDRTKLDDKFDTTKQSIEDGTYKSGDESLTNIARINAEGKISDEEKALTEHFAEIAATKTREVVRTIALRRLDEQKTRLEDMIADTNGHIDRRTTALERTADRALEKAQKESRDLRMDWTALVATSSDEQFDRAARQQIEEGFRKRYGDKVKDWGEEELKARVERRFEPYKQMVREYRTASSNANGGDRILKEWESERADQQTALARVESVMQQYQA